MARRLAKLGRLSAYLEGLPSEVVNRRSGRLNPAAEAEEALTRAVLADFERAEQRKRDAGGKPAAGLAQLREIGAAMGSGGERG